MDMMPEAGLCPVCSRQIRNGVAYVSFGAVADLLLLKRKGLSDQDFEGFFHVGFHGVDPDMTDSANHCVAESVKGGQMNLSFCSLPCVRQWFSNIIDRLERELEQSRK